MAIGELANFIVEANIHTWAAEGSEVEPERKGYKDLEYRNGVWRLRDSYTGYFRAPGMTTVYYRDRPAWTMAYGGTGMTKGNESLAEPTFAFLKLALMKVTPEVPFRGPEEFSQDEWRYLFNLLADGDITDFIWREAIYKDGKIVFTQTGIGGLVLSKDENRNPLLPWNF